MEVYSLCSVMHLWWTAVLYGFPCPFMSMLVQILHVYRFILRAQIIVLELPTSKWQLGQSGSVRVGAHQGMLGSGLGRGTPSQVGLSGSIPVWSTNGKPEFDSWPSRVRLSQIHIGHAGLKKSKCKKIEIRNVKTQKTFRKNKYMALQLRQRSS